MKHRYRKYEGIAANNKGVSLIELIVSIVILFIMTAPLLHGFIVSVNLNTEAKRLQQQTDMVQNIIEEIKLYSVEEIAKTYNYPEDGSIVYEAKQDGLGGFEGVDEGERSCIRREVNDPNGNHYRYDFLEKANQPYYFARENITAGSACYDAIIKIDPTVYIDTDFSGNPVGYNTVLKPLLCDVNHTDNVVAIQAYEAELAAATLYENHIYYCMEQEIIHEADIIPYSITYHTLEEIRGLLEKSIQIQIQKPDSDVNVEVYMEYACSAYEGCGSIGFPISGRTLLPENGNIYIFYYPSYKDHVNISKEASVTEEIDVYLYKQNSTSELTVAETIDTPPSGINLYSNVNFPGILSEPVKKDEEKNRIHHIKVQLFQAGRNFQPDSLIMELESTKGE
ncbi:MAG TPA: type II secretion system protein [Mobilitalea sp.]|nr:type II secretion system protein [Mobilitalea sp.]